MLFWVEAIAYQNDLASFTQLLTYKRYTGSLINVTITPAMAPESPAAAKAEAEAALSRIASVTTDGELVFGLAPIRRPY